MPDWSSPVVIGQAFSAAQALLWICVGLMLCDTVRFASFDWAILTGQRARRWPQLPYLFAKVCLWSFLLTNIIFVLAIHEINCNGVLQAVEMQMGWITAASSVLLAFRAVCVYSGRERTAVAALLTVFTLGLLVAWMVGVPDGVAAWVPNGGNPWQDGACNFVSMSSKYAIKYIVTIAYDLCVMLLTVIGVVRMNGSSRIGSVLVQQGLLYFVATFLINAMVAGLTLAKLNPVMSLIGAIPAATVCVMCSTRLYVELAHEALPRPGGVSTSHISSSGTGEKIARILKRSGGNEGRHEGFSSQSNSFTLRNGPAGYNVKPLQYGRHGSHSPTELKSVDHGSSDDLEAQATRDLAKQGEFVAVTESQVVISEPMPDYLAGHPFLPSQQAEAIDNSAGAPLHPHPYSQDVKGHFPRLSK